MNSTLPSIVFMFSGQGSQYYHMGRELYADNELFRSYMTEINAFIEHKTNRSLIDTIYDDTKIITSSFNNLLYSSLSIFMVEYSLARLLIESDIQPDIVLGSSLGELASLAVSNVLDVETVISLIINVSEEVKRKSQPGRMIGILSSPELYHNNLCLREKSEIAAVNFDGHFVISCSCKEIDGIEAFLLDKNVPFQVLPVEIGFHSSLIEPAKYLCEDLLENVNFRSPELSYISCAYADFITSFQNRFLWDLFRKPLLFQDAIRKLESMGNHIYIDLGPSGTLAQYVNYILESTSDSLSCRLMTPFNSSISNFKKMKSILNNHITSNHKGGKFECWQ